MPREYRIWNLNIERLYALYMEETGQLEQSLLRGVAWEDVTEQRKK